MSRPNVTPATRPTLTMSQIPTMSRTTSIISVLSVTRLPPGARPVSRTKTRSSRSTGAHISVTCISCHANGYQNTPRECYACHESDYSGVADPNHIQNSFSQICTQCHTTAAWLPATYDHNLSPFPLTGAHVSTPCVSCHAGGFDNTPSDCYTCHQADYGGVQDPNHVTNNFDHVCTVCHTTTAWQPVSFNHANTEFPSNWRPCLARLYIVSC